MENQCCQIKASIRKAYQKKRREMQSESVKIASQSIVEQILENPIYQQAQTLFCYYPSNNECNILKVAKHALKEGKTVAFPKSFSKPNMKFYSINTLDAFSVGQFNIMEPTSTKSIKPDDQTLILVPGLAFDSRKFRIGYGGGYYDFYFEKYAVTAKKIGVFYQWQKTPIIPIESHDIALDHIICNR